MIKHTDGCLTEDFVESGREEKLLLWLSIAKRMHRLALIISKAEAATEWKLGYMGETNFKQ